MKVEEIKRVILSQEEEIKEKFEKTKIIEREINKERLRGFLKAPNILAILGIRRCGKSILSWQIFEKNFGYVNFDDERLAGIKARDLDKVLQAFYELYGDIDKIILDEPQNVEKWELFANRLRRTKKVIITGSNSRLLSGELATTLTGRHVEFTLFPFSFKEFLVYRDFKFEDRDIYSTRKIALLKRLLSEYIEVGGFPEAYLFGKEMLARIYSDIIEKDVIRRARVKKKAALREMTKYLISNFSSEFTFSKLKNVLKIKDVHTIKNWVDIVSDAYLIKILERYSPKLKEQIIAPKKVYCIDSGLINSIAFRTSENKGKLMENLVFLELLRKKNYENPLLEFYYWKDYQQREVDFVVKEGNRVRQLIQVTHAGGRDEVEKREIRSLLKASDLLGCRDLMVITWDYEAEEKIKGKKVKFLPLWKWLIGY